MSNWSLLSIFASSPNANVVASNLSVLATKQAHYNKYVPKITHTFLNLHSFLH